MIFGGAGGVKTLTKMEISQLSTVLEAIGTIVNSLEGLIIDGGTKSGIMVVM